MNRVVTVAAAVAAALLLAVPPAGAGGMGQAPPAEPRPSGPPVSGTTPPRQEGTNQPATAQVRTCSLYAGDGTYGMTCRGGTGDSATYAEILGGEAVPDCWHEDVLPGFEPPEVKEELPRGGRWYLRTCLTGGIDPETKVGNGELTFSQTPEYVAPPDRPIDLLPGQQIIVSGQRNTRQIPEPFVQPSPSAKPRVGQDLAFYVPESNTSGATITVRGPGIGTVQMRARMTDLTVWPKGTASPVVSCPGGGLEVTRTDTRDALPNACWWRFDRSSANQPNNRYPMQVQAGWVVEYNADGAWQTLGTFTKEQGILQRVVEVQTIVVP